ncbi:hypothetical protein CAP31_01725 [Sulfuriferula sp. AH1]|uniref:EAL domain-containing protein n=1 Tax=Sulfuriferula sp. AH1 TaxID=1985873 RepID=UPI000B3B629C|nr:EAL domain-containing protein [Sulfuriferula sp. AH1]ARU30524.1 hypothetical protein CAP31_01725 [Sulfuriferula sp. AH1]
MIKLSMRFWQHLGLLSRLLLAITCVIIITSVLMVAVQMAQEQADGNRRAHQTVHELRELIVPAVGGQAIVGDYSGIRQLLQNQVRLRPDLLKLEWRYRGMVISVVDPAPVVARAPDWFVHWASIPALRSMQPITISGQEYGSLRIVLNPAHELNSIWKEFVRLAQFAFVALLLIWLSSYFILRRNLIVLDRLVVAVDAMKRGKHDVQVRERGAPELRGLVRAFNDGNKRLGLLIAELHQREAAQAAQLEQITAQNFAYQEQRRAMDAAAIIAETDLAGNIMFVNDKFCMVSGYTPDELFGQNHRMLNSGMHAPDFFDKMWQAIGRGKIWHGEICNRARDGRLYWVYSTIVPILDEGTHQPKRYQAIYFDITARKQLETALQLEKERAEVTLASIGDAVMTTDIEGKVTFLNEIAERLTGWSANEAIGMAIEQIFNIVNEVTRQPADNPVRKVVREKHVVGLMENLVLISRTGIEYNIEDSAAPICMSDGNMVGCVLVFHDVTEKHRLMSAVHWQAGHDALTNLPNRTLLNDRFVRALANARRNSTLTAVCLLDLDEFKPINDLFGHEAGDAVLVEVAHRLTGVVRGEDTVARLGGDEFVLLLNEFGDMDEVELAVHRILTMVAAPYRIGNEDVKINASIGMTLYPLDDADPDTLLRHADQAMYQAKQAGRNRYYLFDLASNMEAQTSLRKIERVRQALLDDEFCLYYQPKVNMRSGKVVGMEALIRWHHPERGIVPPLEFLPLIEQTDLIVELGEWVITHALQQVEAWMALGQEWTVSVNIAGLHFQRSDFCERLSALLAAYPHVPSNLLQIEILESATLGDLGYAHDMVVRCRKLGVSFALDDFGTGYSSLTYLKRLPANVLKIDQSFVRDMLVDKEGLALVEAVISLASVFGSEVIAEGVETAEHGVLLMRLGCDLAQGYGIAHPMPAAKVMDWVRQYKPDPSWAVWSDTHWDLSDFPLLVAQHDHLSWVKKVVASVFDSPLTLPKSELVDHHQCRFGHWYYGVGRQRYGRLPEFAALEKIHAEVHQVGMEIVSLNARGEKEAAKAMSEKLMLLKDKVLISLGNLQRTVALNLH